MQENYDLVRPEVVEYVETEILPRYEKTAGHGVDHIRNAIRRSLIFARKINEGEIKVTEADFEGLPESLRQGKSGDGGASGPQIDYDMVFVVAAFHDLGRERNDRLHHLVSAGFLLLDEKMWELFDKEQLRVMADAVMDHRASNGFLPATIYGRIVSSADRDTDWKVIVKRAYDYNRAKWPEKTPLEALEVVREKLYIKFGAPEAYGAKKMFFPNPEYEEMIREFQKITPEFDEFLEVTREIVGL